MAKHYLLARLGGADSGLLADEGIASQTGETARFTAMACVLLTTAGVACLSMFFALHTAVGVGTGGSVILALAWGVAIINIDRFLIVTMNGTRGKPVRLAVAMLFRLLLAAVISVVVATPIVLRVFASDITAARPVLQQQQSATYARNNPSTSDGEQLADAKKAVSAQEAIVSNDNAATSTLSDQYGEAQATADRAHLILECEIQGYREAACHGYTTGGAGVGPFAQADQAAYNRDVAAAASIKARLDKATAALGNDTTVLGQLRSAEKSWQAKVADEIAADDKDNAQDTGLLEQIHALFEASASDPSLAWAHWTVTALFFIIEILPVSIKCLLLVGPATPYEQILDKRGEAAVDRAAARLAAETEIARLRARSARELAELEVRAEHEARRERSQGNHAVPSDVEWWR